jgi:hypothetical protein
MDELKFNSGDEARQRLVAAAQRFQSAQHGGLDSKNAEDEKVNAQLLLDEAVTQYYENELRPDFSGTNAPSDG